jgi:SAM-dependent methyltransferase
MSDNSEENDSTYGDSVRSETASLASSIFEYQYENGRRYHSFQAGRYFAPDDEQEQERLDLVHHIQSMILGGELYRAPIERPLRILDVGTGTGIWAMDIGDKFPHADIVATDLSPIQPLWTPPNLQFEIDDCEAEWTYKEKFDFIHIRNMGGAISDWPRLLEQALNHLRPGGWIEVGDFEVWGSTDDNSLPEDSSYNIWQNNLKKAGEKTGRIMNIIPQMKDLVTQAGFEQVQEDTYKASHAPKAMTDSIDDPSSYHCRHGRKTRSSNK